MCRTTTSGSAELTWRKSAKSSLRPVVVSWANQKMRVSPGLAVWACVTYSVSGYLTDVLGSVMGLRMAVTSPVGASGSMYAAKTSFSTLLA